MGLLVCSPFFEVPQKESSTKDEKKATKDEEMKDEQSEGFPQSMDDRKNGIFLVECDCNL